MKKIKYLNWNRFKRISLVKTLWFNFYKLPFKQAVKLPIVVSKYTDLRKLSGDIVIKSEAYFGMITIGFAGDDTVSPKSNRVFIYINKGRLVFEGKSNIGCGNVIRINHGVLTLGNDFTSGANVKFYCWNKISIGRTCRVAWESQILDTNFHFLKNLETGEVGNIFGEIIIGDFCWIGNRCSLTKKAALPNHTTVASNSFVNKDFRQIALGNTIIAGSPAKIQAEGYERVFNKDEEKRLKSNLI